MLSVQQDPLARVLKTQSRKDEGERPTRTTRRTRCSTLSTQIRHPRRSAPMSCAITCRKKGNSASFLVGWFTNRFKIHILGRPEKIRGMRQTAGKMSPRLVRRVLLPTRNLRYGKQPPNHPIQTPNKTFSTAIWLLTCPPAPDKVLKYRSILATDSPHATGLTYYHA